MIVIVSHREPLIDVWSRSGDASEWSRHAAGAGQRARLPALDCSLDVDAIYSAAEEPD